MESLFNKVVNNRLKHRSIPVNFGNILKTSFLQSASQGLLPNSTNSLV